ncbi:MAG: hypothetical protein UX57_C0007G0002 [Candidatus Uhrbacteria bacterium GW2011_GWE2_46_68]|uniref:Uncharacterized protein n=2 Tax=Candidatus Uhriibacteriota TaxID=1752732 RepID=A0A0G1T6G3_9BACT|nr:MAG: hypothetical protein UX45_C0023G0018 [Candidatus Uhrbacteria bacterium GW2011_GWF2_46_218]KKU40970.1 MAG: hypothetical protein UX57_C0007G0002 [Candidatus Uhrbacteria bacterium GW2011_GWE2_46_68]
MRQIYTNQKYRLALSVALFVCLATIGFGCLSKNESKDTQEGSVVIDRQAILEDAKEAGLIMDDDELQAMADVGNLVTVEGEILMNETVLESAKKDDYRVSGALADVTAGGSFGVVKSKSEEGTFTLYATVGALPVLHEDQHYEAWLVKRDALMRVVSLGDLTVPAGEEERWSFLYTSKEDLSQYDFFVFTSEWNDTNPTPGLHILEGVME